eukprot:TRINITY_DN12742_c1_g1_i1.p1 TRINITY_DN12742_c1_g1~~TRINITY_DN12742_c1_g1_i1.p1  ORF type:complete len:131 (+),score=22.05 TRINITY_DN12742_c1_g1_i1:44-394(+)
MGSQDDGDLGGTVPLPESRPCAHNCWEDIRTRKKSKVLRCILCNSRWRAQARDIARCTQYYQTEECHNGADCEKLHVSKKQKKPVEPPLDITSEETLASDPEAPSVLESVLLHLAL